MKKQGVGKRSLNAGALAAMSVALLLLVGGTAWAKKGEKIQLKSDASSAPAAMAPAARQPDPFRDLLMMQREMERMFNSTLSPYSGVPEFEAVADSQVFEQATDLRETPDAFIVEMDLPGLDKSDISIEVKDRVLSVSGQQRKVRKEKKGERILLQERSMSAFSRDIVLPKSVDVDKVEASYKDGVLTITLPKTEKDKAVRKVEIK